jgi:hypothetical protein
MKHSILFAAALASGAPLAAPSAAQIAPGRSGSSTMSYLGEKEIWPVVSEFGSCYAEVNRLGALKLIATVPNSPAEAQTYRKLFTKPYQSCLGDVTSLGGMAIGMIRGAIAEGLYKKRIPLPANLMLAAPAPGQIRNLSHASLCYAAAHPDAARALIAQTKPGSRKEFDAVVAVMPDFRRCIPKGALNTRFDATQIRFRIAEALLRTGVPLKAAEVRN